MDEWRDLLSTGLAALSLIPYYGIYAKARVSRAARIDGVAGRHATLRTGLLWCVDRAGYCQEQRASVYAALERLQRKGFVVSSLGEPLIERGGKARTYFRPTPAGIKEARETHATLMRLSDGLSGLKGQPA